MYRENVCENAYEFGDGLPRSRLYTANGEGRGRFDYMSEGGNLPRIGSQSLASRDQFGQLMGGPGVYQTLTSATKAGTANPGRRMPIIRQAEALDENRIVLYKKGKQLGQGYYIVEISSNNTHLFIAAYDVESPESLLIELPEKRATDILKEFENDYESMASSLQVMNKRLVLLNPVSIHHVRLMSNSLYYVQKFVQKRGGTAPAGAGRPPHGAEMQGEEGQQQMAQAEM